MKDMKPIFLAMIVIGLVLLVVIWLAPGAIADKQETETEAPLDTFVAMRSCQFVDPPTGDQRWAVCNDGSLWTVDPLSPSGLQPPWQPQTP